MSRIRAFILLHKNKFNKLIDAYGTIIILINITSYMRYMNRSRNTNIMDFALGILWCMCKGFLYKASFPISAFIILYDILFNILINRNHRWLHHFVPMICFQFMRNKYYRYDIIDWH
jgi:hypothetical protein